MGFFGKVVAVEASFRCPYCLHRTKKYVVYVYSIRGSENPLKMLLYRIQKVASQSVVIFRLVNLFFILVQCLAASF